MPRCIIFGALEVSNIPEKLRPDDYVIAADRGYQTALSLGIEPDLVVGDFDSLGDIPDVPNLIRLNVRKDDTDLEHAAVVGLEKGYTEFIVYGAVGGKLDHTLGNIAVAERIALAGGQAVFCGNDSSFTVIHNASSRFPIRDGGRISVFPLGGCARGVSITGLSYEVSDITLNGASTLGCGNAFIGKASEISVKDGTLLIVYDTSE